MCEWLECYKGGDLAYWKVTEAAGRGLDWLAGPE
jgi:hypothetical protein